MNTLSCFYFERLDPKLPVLCSVSRSILSLFAQHPQTAPHHGTGRTATLYRGRGFHWECSLLEIKRTFKWPVRSLFWTTSQCSVNKLRCECTWQRQNCISFLNRLENQLGCNDEPLHCVYLFE